MWIVLSYRFTSKLLLIWEVPILSIIDKDPHKCTLSYCLLPIFCQTSMHFVLCIHYLRILFDRATNYKYFSVFIASIRCCINSVHYESLLLFMYIGKCFFFEGVMCLRLGTVWHVEKQRHICQIWSEIINSPCNIGQYDTIYAFIAFYTISLNKIFYFTMLFGYNTPYMILVVPFNNFF